MPGYFFVGHETVGAHVARCLEPLGWVSVGDATQAVIWLDNQSGSQFVGDIKTIDARNCDGKSELAGGNLNETIYGGSSQNSLWGGNGGNDLIFGGAGQNLFFWTNGNGNDTISGTRAGDVVMLSQVTFENIAGTAVNGNVATINFNDGGSLTVNDASNCDFVIANQTFYINGNDFAAK